MKMLANKYTPIFGQSHRQRGLGHDEDGVPKLSHLKGMTREQILHYIKRFRKDITKNDIIALVREGTNK